MAKYTADDPDIKYLDKYDQINYNFEMLKYDVDKNQEVHIGAASAKFIADPAKIGDMFKSPLKFTVGIFAILCYVMFVVLVIFLVFLLVLRASGGPDNDAHVEIMWKISKYLLVATLLIVLLYWLLNKITVEMTTTGFVAK